ncbi:SDR family NAD(P)-dependent oxidoreductase [Hyphococcus sp.]|uniref:SDR family NAD(P)-dependent oxidoreductase n=1 Tax=Hyphococcus sp. TaxID=2038636 RepID=UPI003CCC0F93
MNTQKKHIFITGGGSGIGLAVARAFAGAGHDVTISGRNENRLKDTGFSYAIMDVTDENAVAETAATIKPVDILIANAGIAATAPFVKTSLQDWNAVLAANLTGVFLCARAFAPAMVENNWGRIIAIASTASIKPYHYSSAYVASKHGVLGLIKTLALELAKTGVTANAICPGFTDTPMFEQSVSRITGKTDRTSEEAAALLLKDQPMSRLVDPAEIAETALWLASNAARTINGQAIAIDGGETMR